jgi:hypothetical protein
MEGIERKQLEIDQKFEKILSPIKAYSMMDKYLMLMNSLPKLFALPKSVLF